MFDSRLGICCLYLMIISFQASPMAYLTNSQACGDCILTTTTWRAYLLGSSTSSQAWNGWGIREQPVHPHSRPGPLLLLLSDPCHGLHKSFASSLIAGSCQHQSHPVHPQNSPDRSLADDSSRSHRHCSCIPESPTSLPPRTRKQEHCQSLRNLRSRPSREGNFQDDCIQQET